MKIKSKRGFTLVELIVSALITVIIIGAAAAAVALGLEIFNSATKTAAQQRRIKLAETALKENILIAQSYTIGQRAPGTVPEADDGIYLYFDNDVFVILINGSTITVRDIESVEIDFEKASNLCRARYTITPPGLSHSGVIVMNNIKDIAPNAARCTLTPGSLTVLNMVLPQS